MASVAVVGLVLAPLLRPVPAHAVYTPSYTGKIAYWSDIDGSGEVYLANADSSNPVRVTTNGGAYDQPTSWSPDGSKLLYYSDIGGDSEIYVMDADGSNQTQLTAMPGSYDYGAVWSPDGTKLAFLSNTGTAEIYVINADGSNPLNVSTNAAEDFDFDWSPDSAKIAFRTYRDGGQAEIYTMNADGSNKVRLTTNTSSDMYPLWSPDGSTIVFMALRDGNEELYRMNADGSNPINLTQTANLKETFPAWSPDGTQIAYYAQVLPGGTTSDIRVMNADGSTQHTVVDIDAFPGQDTGDFQWSPDGATVAVTTYDTGYYQYLVNPDGTNLRQILNPANNDSYLVWQPLPNQAPVATSDTLVVPANTSGSLAVLANDADEEALSGSNLTITVQPDHGAATVNADTGKFTFTPTTGYTGPDSLTYQICDSFLLDQKCSTGVLSITVQAGPQPATPTITSIGAVQIHGATTVYYTGHRPTFSGTAEAVSTITVTINSDPIVLTTTADSTGAWSVTPDQDIPDGEHTVTITATKDGSTSEPLTITLGINTFIPDTGADSTALCLLGVALLAGGVGTGLLRRRRVSAHRVPSLFP